VLEIDAKVVLSVEVSAVKRHISLLVGGGDAICVRHVWAHHEAEAKRLNEMSEEGQSGDTGIRDGHVSKSDGRHIYLSRLGASTEVGTRTNECLKQQPRTSQVIGPKCAVSLPEGRLALGCGEAAKHSSPSA
jgi:hypothetical protein